MVSLKECKPNTNSVHDQLTQVLIHPHPFTEGRVTPAQGSASIIQIRL